MPSTVSLVVPEQPMGDNMGVTVQCDLGQLGFSVSVITPHGGLRHLDDTGGDMRSVERQLIIG